MELELGQDGPTESERLAKIPEGEPKRRFWLAVAARGQEARPALPIKLSNERGPRDVRLRGHEDQTHLPYFQFGFRVYRLDALQRVEEEVPELARFRVAVTELAGQLCPGDRAH